MLGPFGWLVLTALKTPAEMAPFPSTGGRPQPQWRTSPTRSPASTSSAAPANSLTIAFIYATLTTLSSAWVGFGFARLTAPGKKQLFVVLLATMMLPGIVTLVPTYLIFAKLQHGQHVLAVGGLGAGRRRRTWSSCSGSSSPACPKELEEAAIIDGCGYVGIFWRIFLPQSWPVIAASVILSFTGAWGDYIGPACC